MYNPLVSEYKLNFIAYRLLQTLFGGIDFRNDQNESSYVFIFCKVFIFIYPFLVGFVFNFFIHFKLLDQLLSAIFSGIICFLITIFIHILVKRDNSVHIFPISIENKPSMSAKRLLIKLLPSSAQKSYLTLTVYSIFSFCLVCLALYSINLLNLLKNFNDNWFVSIVLYIICWFTIILSHNSLTSGPPPETATYSTIESNDFISSFNRPIHVLIVLFIQSLNTLFFEQNFIQILCPLLLGAFPLLWLFGVIPPVTALFQWFVERLNVVVFGGGPSHSSIKSLIQLLISTLLLLICWAIDRTVPLIYISTIFGFLMSNDLTTNLKCREITLRSAIIHISLIISIILIDIISSLNNLNLISIDRWLILVMAILIVFVSFLRYSQSVYLFFGLIRNPIYPKSSSGISVFQKFKQKWNNWMILMKILIQFIIPIVCLFCVNLEINQFFDTRIETMTRNSNVTESNEKLLSLPITFAIISIHRSIWQKTCISSMIVIFSYFLNFVNCNVFGLSPPLQWFSFDFLTNVAINISEKLYLVIILLITSVLVKNQRFPMTSCLIGFDLIIFPFILSMVVISSIISAPILPVFTLPLFLISFARPTHFWPNINKSEIETNDTIYYQQLMPDFIDNMVRQCPVISTGRAGDYLLARFDDRLIWIQILESGFNFVRVQVKGLELQETSCHAVEATAIDEMIDEAFYTGADNKKHRIFNSYFWYAIQPLDTVLVKTYSDARNVLTGVIDSPQTFLTIKTLFSRVFVWVLLKHRLKKENHFSRIERHESVISETEKQVDSTTTNPNLEAKSVLFYDVLKTKAENTSEELTQFGVNGIDLSKWSDDEEESDVLGTDTQSNRQSSQQSQKDILIKESIIQIKESIIDSKQQNEELFDKVFESKQQMDSNLISNSELNSGEKFFNTFDNNGNKTNRNTGSSGDSSNTFSNKTTPITDTWDNPYTSLSPTDEWLTAALDYSYRKRINQSVNQFLFTDDWFKTIINTLCDNYQQLTDTQMSSLIDSYKQISLVCFSCILPLNPISTTTEMSAQTIYQIFNGNIPDNGLNRNFLHRNEDLHEVIIKSFQYCLKIALDLILMADDMPSMNQLIEVLLDYDNNWFIGDESTIEWKNSVIAEKKHLFSMGRDAIKECFTSHLLSLQEIAVHLCYLNRAVIEAIWSSLSLELLYLTNDDDERFSIQANPVIVRNLTVQAANVPIGYPVYVSLPILINQLKY